MVPGAGREEYDCKGVKLSGVSGVLDAVLDGTLIIGGVAIPTGDDTELSVSFMGVGDDTLADKFMVWLMFMFIDIYILIEVFTGGGVAALEEDSETVLKSARTNGDSVFGPRIF